MKRILINRRPDIFGNIEKYRYALYDIYEMFCLFVVCHYRGCLATAVYQQQDLSGCYGGPEAAPWQPRAPRGPRARCSVTRWEFPRAHVSYQHPEGWDANRDGKVGQPSALTSDQHFIHILN